MKTAISKISFFFLFAVFANCAAITSTESVEALKRKADEYFIATAYQQAIKLYQDILQGQISNEIFEDTIQKLGQAYLITEQYSSLIELLKDKANDSFGYLLGCAYNRMSEYHLASIALPNYLSRDREFRIEAKFELALANLFSGNLDEAEKLFLSFSSEKVPSEIFLKSKLYLAKIYSNKNEGNKAEKILSEILLFPQLDKDIAVDCKNCLGEVYLQMNQIEKSLKEWESASELLGIQSSQNIDVSRNLGRGYLYLAKQEKSLVEVQNALQKAEKSLRPILDQVRDEQTLLILGECYVLQSTKLKDQQAFAKLEELFSPDLKLSKLAQTQVLLLRAQAAPTYEMRERLYSCLTQEQNNDIPFDRQAWLYRGLNDYEEFSRLLNTELRTDDAQKLLLKAVEEFNIAFQFLIDNDSHLAEKALKYQIKSILQLEQFDQTLALFNRIDKLISSEKMKRFESPDELLYLQARLSFCLYESTDDKERYLSYSEKILRKNNHQFSQGKFIDLSLNMLGVILFHQKKYEEAITAFKQVWENFSDSDIASESLFWASKSAEFANNDSLSKEYKKLLWEKYPDSKFSPEAFFSYYTFKEYLQGNKLAQKHLQGFLIKYPQTPYSIIAWHLIGLDCKRDQRATDGKLKKKNLIKAIDAFQEAENVFENLASTDLLSEKRSYYALIRYRSTLERAQANLSISEESQSAKKEIYLQYSEELLQHLIEELNMQKFLLASEATALEEDASYLLAKTYKQLNKQEQAEQLIATVLRKYQEDRCTRGYILSRFWYEKGCLEEEKKNYAEALQAFATAEDAAKGKILTTDQKLDLWIRQSECYKALRDFDNALLFLSKAVNDSSVSNLRIKAMFLRTDIYELQGRKELARRQLIATAKKGGEWSVKAKEKLHECYD